MDPVICCLLGICCPPAERRIKVAKHFAGHGVEERTALALADDLIARIDQSHLGSFLSAVVKAARGEK